MPLVQCPECQKEVSSEARSCPQCAFPYPGKKDRLNGKSSETLLACQDCGSPISKFAHACPHCGAPTANHQTKAESPEAVEPEADVSVAGEQTWLCPNCGVPYTRRTKERRGGLDGAGSSAVGKIPLINLQEQNFQEEEFQALDGRLAADKMVLRKERKRSPLWEEAKAMYEEESQFSRPRKKWNVTLLVILAVLLVFVVSFAFFGLKGLNPLEALVYWQM
ncbi:MAG: hypothetical protein NPIRA05_06820 [Nitrospirales bacterium]|nr:MAG: hypothetical protein NPIRA05_06820 [Nitrospirales bacterium]